MRGRYRMTVGMIGALGLMAAACGTDSGTESDVDTTATSPAPLATDAPDDDSSTIETTEPEAATTTEAVTELADDLPLIVATTTIWADVTRNVVCGTLAEVVNVVPAGVDSHQYEPSLQDRGLMGSADLLVINGLLLEEGLTGTIEAVEAEGVAVFALAEVITDLIEFDDDHGHGHDDDTPDDDHGHDDGHGHSHDDDKHDDGHGHDDDKHDDDHGHDHGDDDPHVWFDPVRVASALPALAEAIVAATGVDSDRIDECVTDYQAELLDVDTEMVAIFDAIPEGSRILVTTHESLGYLADRYDFEIIGTVLAGTSSMAETNPADLEDLAQDIIAAGVPALFAEAESSAADIEALAARIGDVEVVELRTESLGEPGSGADTYASFLRATATTITDALAG
jgi:zinc/manganese transport system substrate-binding protein